MGSLPTGERGRVRGDLDFWLGPAFVFDSILNCEPNRKMTERLQVGNVGRRKNRQVKAEVKVKAEESVPALDCGGSVCY